MVYKGLLAGYTYNESMTQNLIIPGMEAPPPIPPKKRKRRQVGQTCNECGWDDILPLVYVDFAVYIMLIFVMFGLVYGPT